MAVYGEQSPPFNELMLPCPVDPYGVAKYAVEMDIKLASEQFGLEYNIVRPHNVLGVYQNIWDRYRNVIGIFIRRVLNDEPMLVFGDGEQTRAFSDIQYYMQPLEQLIDNHNGETFNIGADKVFTINEIANILMATAAKYNKKATIEHIEYRHEVKHAYCNHKKAKNMLVFNDKTNVETLIEEMFLWYKYQPNREVKNHVYEIEKNLYSFWK